MLCRWHYLRVCLSTLAHFARRILVSYGLGPAYKYPVLGLVKGGQLRSISPLFWLLCVFLLLPDRPTRDQEC